MQCPHTWMIWMHPLIYMETWSNHEIWFASVARKSVARAKITSEGNERVNLLHKRTK